MSLKRTKKVRLDIYRSHDIVAISGQWVDIVSYQDMRQGFSLANCKLGYDKKTRSTLYHSCFQTTTKVPVLRKLVRRVSGQVRHLALIKVDWGNSIDIELTVDFLSNFTYRLKRTLLRSGRTFNNPHNSLNYPFSKTILFEPFTLRSVRVEKKEPREKSRRMT